MALAEKYEHDIRKVEELGMSPAQKKAKRRASKRAKSGDTAAALADLHCFNGLF